MDGWSKSRHSYGIMMNVYGDSQAVLWQLGDSLNHCEPCQVLIVGSIFRQEFSWNSLNITLPTIRKLLTHHEDQNFRDEIFFHTFDDSRNSLQSIELCYNCRHVEENGRNRGDPWSLRQMGVYHSYNAESQQSIWIILQPPSRILEGLRGSLKNLMVDSASSIHTSLSLHFQFLSLTGENLHSYLEHLWVGLDELDEKACFARVGKSTKVDYPLEFEDRQKVHRSYGKFQRTLLALDSRLELLECYSSFACKISETQAELSLPVDMLIVQTRTYRRRMISFINRLRSTAEVLSKILEFRSQEALAATTRAMRDNIDMLRHISAQTQQDQHLLGMLARQAHQESKSVRALTVIATMYLPASLLAQIFSSNLVQLSSSDSELPKSHFVPTSQFWIFVLATFALMLLTWGSNALLVRRLS